MANVRIDLDHELLHGEELVFKAPCDCTAVSGIKVYYPSEGSTVSKILTFRDAHGNDLASIGNLFSKDAIVKAIVDTTSNFAYLQNADTNSYIESRFKSLVRLNISADEQLVGKNIEVYSGDTSFTYTVPASMSLVVALPFTGVWYVTNPVTGRIAEVEANYYGDYFVDVRCYRRFTVIIDHSIADPEKCCTYADNAVGMTPGGDDWWNETIFKDLKNCVLVNGSVLGYLNKNNLNQFEDGSAADITTIGHDVMLEIPYRVGYRIEWLDTNRLEVSITDHPNDPDYYYDAFSLNKYNDCDKIYIGTYECCCDNSKMYSSSEKTPTSNFKNTYFRNDARARGTGYQPLSYGFVKLFQCLFVVFYKNLNSQACCGQGRSTGETKYGTGEADTYGFMNEKAEEVDPNYVNDGQRPVKCFGIENLWGNYWNFVDGIATDSSGAFYTCECAKDFNDNRSNYIGNEMCNTRGVISFITKPIGNSKAGFAPKVLGGSDSSFYCDGTTILESRVGLIGGSASEKNRCGIFYFDFTVTPNDTLSTVTSRLMYMHKEV